MGPSLDCNLNMLLYGASPEDSKLASRSLVSKILTKSLKSIH